MRAKTTDIRDQFWMMRALELAQKAEQEGEVPVGAVLVIEDQIIGEGYNKPIVQCDPTAHAEILAMREAAEKIQNYRLLNSTLYVTLEPCAMCTGAMIHARIQRLVFGAHDPRAGAIDSIFQIANEERLNHRFSWEGGVRGEQCGQLLKDFFREKRLKSRSRQLCAH